MAFISDIKQSLGLDLVKEALDYQIINFGGRAVYADGFTRVAAIGENEIILSLKRKYIKISGQNLRVVYLEETSIAVKGEINSVITESI